MPKIEELKSQYLKDIDMMSSKPRFGFFSILPTATAGVSTTQSKKAVKDQNGRVKTQDRNIFSGPTASGVLKKSYFQYSKSVFQGDPYLDPGKTERQQKLKNSALQTNPDVYKPLSLAKTPEVKASYEHIPEKPKKKLKKDVIDENGKVIVEQKNITINLPSKIERERRREVKYVPDEYQNFKKVKKQELFESISKRGEAPFKSSSPVSSLFGKNKEVFGQDENMGKNISQRDLSSRKNSDNNKEHDGAFRPSCIRKFDTFSYPEYMPGGLKPSSRSKKIAATERAETFKLTKQPNNYKPCPSISTMKTNILRKVR